MNFKGDSTVEGYAHDREREDNHCARRDANVRIVVRKVTKTSVNAVMECLRRAYTKTEQDDCSNGCESYKKRIYL